MSDKQIIIRRRWLCSSCGKDINLRLDSYQRMKDGRLLCLDCFIKGWETRLKNNKIISEEGNNGR